jgi:hypothetical protein
MNAQAKVVKVEAFRSKQIIVTIPGGDETPQGFPGLLWKDPAYSSPFPISGIAKPAERRPQFSALPNSYT